ncbi:ROK family protein [Noviherbaspirillum autotrophicum]|uniref:ROK family protein n=1 Tax=Noviherbaspirillum autotrophicum TaxID=709839 RepID=UPI000A067766|nr:ROK family protein [Noviherbaspirillum autotrophicum]
METRYIGAIDIGGTKIAAMVSNNDGPLARAVQPTAKTGTERALPEQAVSLLEQACRMAGIELSTVSELGVSSCGPFVRTNGLTCLSTPNICGGLTPDSDLPNDWTVIPLEQVLREHFDHVRLENDCVGALIAERTFGAVIDEPDCAYVTWSTGIGFGLCVDGHILNGKNGNAGHAGHMLVSERDALCGCGNRGDVESLTSGRNIGARLHTSASKLFNAARDGDEASRALAVEAAQWFGRALYNIVATLDTRVFVIGGSVWQHHGDWLAPVVEREIASHFPALTQGVKLVPAALGPLVADVGALSLVLPADWIAQWRLTSPWERLRDAPPVP